MRLVPRTPLLALAALGCAATEPRVAEAPPPAVSTPPGTAPATSPTPRIEAPAPPPEAAAPGARACGALGCLAFDSAASAFRHVLARKPRVLAVGEAHAQKGGEGVASATLRFIDALLPELAGKASDVVVELWVASGSCGEVEKRVQKQQAPVAASQAASNQSEFVRLGHRAKELGIAPHALTPTCAEYREIAGAGAADVDRMLRLMASATERELEKHLAATAASEPAKMIVAYGGAIHNDVAPRPGREAWSFGPSVLARVGGAYVELDLIVPEFVKDTEAWRSLPWYDAYRETSHDSETLLYAPAPNAFVLVFGKSKP